MSAYTPTTLVSARFGGSPEAAVTSKLKVIVSLVSSVFAGAVAPLVSEVTQTIPADWPSVQPVVAPPLTLKFATVFVSKNTVLRASVTATSYAVANPVFDTTRVTVTTSPASIMFVLSEVATQIRGSTLVTITAPFVTGAWVFPAKLTTALLVNFVWEPAKPELMFVFRTTASKYNAKLLLPPLLSPVTTVLLLKTTETGAPLPPPATPTGEPSVPPNPVVSTRFVTYCMPRGIRSVTTRLLTVPSGSVTCTL